MATYINNIFNFSRSLPSPFDTIANKKIKVSSKYGDGTTSTLCGTVIKAVHAVCHCMDGSGEGAVGIIDHRTAAEYTPNSRKRSNVANYPMSSMVSFERTDFFAAASAPMQPVKPWTNTLPA